MGVKLRLQTSHEKDMKYSWQKPPVKLVKLVIKSEETDIASTTYPSPAPDRNCCVLRWWRTGQELLTISDQLDYLLAALLRNRTFLVFLTVLFFIFLKWWQMIEGEETALQFWYRVSFKTRITNTMSFTSDINRKIKWHLGRKPFPTLKNTVCFSCEVADKF